MPILTDRNSPRIPLDWMHRPEVLEMTNRQFRNASRLMFALFRSTKVHRIQQHAKIRARLVRHFGHMCVYCGDETSPLQIEHIVPLSRGGGWNYENLTLACGPCNRRKRTRTAAEFGFPHIQKLAERERA